MAQAKKDPRLLAVIDALVSDLGPDFFLLNDFWDADLIAAGLSRPGNPNRLVYLAIDPGSNGLVYSWDQGAPGESDFEAQTPRPGTYAEILDAIRRHLGPAPR